MKIRGSDLHSVKKAPCLAVLLLALRFLPDAAAAGIANGDRAPDVPLTFLDGSKAQLGEWLGRQPVYLKIWATWCGTCREEMPHFRAAYEQYGDTVAFISVNAGFNDTIPEVRSFNEEYALQMPTVIDRAGDIGEAFELVATPYHVLIDGDGNIVHLGHRADEAVDRLLNRMAQNVSSEGNADAEAVAGQPRTLRAMPVPGPSVGDVAPAFSIETTSGATFSVGAGHSENDPVYLLFFTTWCESYLAAEGEDEVTADACRQTRQAIDTAFANATDPPTVIAIASRMWTGPEELEAYRDRVDPPYPIALDDTNEVFRRYGIRDFPTLIVISGGRINGRYEGALSGLPAPR